MTRSERGDGGEGKGDDRNSDEESDGNCDQYHGQPVPNTSRQCYWCCHRRAWLGPRVIAAREGFCEFIIGVFEYMYDS